MSKRKHGCKSIDVGKDKDKKIDLPWCPTWPQYSNLWCEKKHCQ